MPTEIEGIAYHHTGDSAPDPQFAKVNEFHKRQNFPISSLGFYVGYPYFIGRDGTIKQARSEEERGAHTANCGCSVDKSGLPKDTANLHYIGICLAGNLSIEKPTAAQMASLVMLTEDIQRRRKIPDWKLLNHKDFKATSCPGIDLVHEVLLIKELRWKLREAEKALDNVSPNRKSALLRFVERIHKRLSPPNLWNF